MNSMTGFGRGTAEAQGREATVEIKAVNSRYLDISFHMPRVLNLMEERVRRLVSTAIGRGKVDVYVAYRNRREDHAQVLVDTALAKGYRKAMDELREQTGLDNDLSLTSLASYPMVLTIMEAEEDEDALWAVVETALNSAIAMLLDMRLREGDRLREDLLSKTKGLRAAIEVIKAAAPAMEQNVRERLMQKMQEFIDADETIRQRVLAEAALLCDKRSVDEEIVRFLSHLDEFEHNLMQSDAVGRKLDFIVQEMNREINTIGSKASEAEINAFVIAIKSEMEKIREQIQNIE